MMIGIYGGTFDPIHFGHLRSALEVSESLGLDEMRWVPCRQPPHRLQPEASAADRLSMLELALAGAPENFVIDRREMERDGPSYMVDTLASMRAQWPEGCLCLVLGQDAFLGLNRWHRWRELIELAHMVVMRRPGAFPLESNAEVANLVANRLCERTEDLRSRLSGLVHFFEVSQLSISASQIRDLFRSRRSPDYLLPGKVTAYIRERGLYVLDEAGPEGRFGAGPGT